mmetsp:Transcript_24987/g.28481  ORF Transcript_24987/g.28481 Transcript_24987/m.28481 type:complete len:85 (+) Transcript_24987:54-308(+)
MFEAYHKQAKVVEKSMDLIHSRLSRRWKGTKADVFSHDPERRGNRGFPSNGPMTIRWMLRMDLWMLRMDTGRSLYKEHVLGRRG